MKKSGKLSIIRVCFILLPLIIVLSAVFVFGGGSKASDNRIILNMGETHAQGHIITEADYLFAELVKEKTNGRISINIHPDGEYGNEKEALSLVKAKSLDIVRLNATALSSESRLIEIFHTPFLFNEKEKLFCALNSDLGDALKNDLSENNLTLLCYYYSGARDFCFSSDNNITNAQGFKAKRIRVNDADVNLTYLNILGANPVPLDFNEIYSAFEANMIDGADINATILEGENITDYAKYLFLLQYKRIPDFMIINSQTFNSLNEEDQKIISDCAKQAQDYELENWDAYQEYILNRLKEDGCYILYPDEEELLKFKNLSRPIYDNLDKELFEKLKLEI